MILVGPSGCGKSTALRMIAGLEDISEGELKIGGEVVNELAPKDRDIAMVFQNYALYPHMTVRENMGFALKLAGVDKDEIDRKVEEAARTLDLEQHLDRRPANLSGGQRQRVAMGRAIVRDPKAFLMDEPLSNLDAKLRVQMRTEVARLQSQTGDDDRLRHPRPDRGDDARRPGRGDAGRRPAAGRHARRALRQPEEPLRRRLHRLAGDELHAGRDQRRQGEAADRRGRAERRASGGGHDGKVVAGLRPESFEDAGLVGDLAEERGIVFEAEIDLVESLGSDLFAYFHVESEGVQSDQLADLIADRLEETGAAEQREGQEQLVARLDPASKVKRRDTAKLWADTAKLHLFDPESGESLARSGGGDQA